MAPAKLTDQDKHTILERYRQPSITAADLAADFGVSASTISRILRTGLETREYERLQWLKRQTSPATPAPTPEAPADAVVPEMTDASTGQFPETEAVNLPELPELALSTDTTTAIKPSHSAPVKRRRSSEQPPESLGDAETAGLPLRVETISSQLDTTDLLEIQATEASEEFSEFDDEFALGSEDEDGEESDEQTNLATMVAGRGTVQVLSLTEAQLPQVLYLVVDRLGDLVTCPLSSFPELGQIASEELEAQVLPLFDNHRVAKRFCKRSQKVLKVPDSRVLGKTQQRLMAKGICRFLLDGNLYALN